MAKAKKEEKKSIFDCESFEEFKEKFFEDSGFSESEFNKKYNVNDLLEIYDNISATNERSLNFRFNIEEDNFYDQTETSNFSLLMDSFKESLSFLADNNQTFENLRPFSKENIKTNYSYFLPNGKKFFVLYFNDNFVIGEINNKLATVSYKILENVKYQIKNENIDIVFSSLAKNMIDIEKNFNYIDYFAMFTEYFSIDEKLLYSLLGNKNKEILYKEICRSSNVLNGKKISEW